MGEVIRKTKDGRFVGWYVRWVDADGRRKQRASHQPTAALARKMLVEIEARVGRGKAGIEEADESHLTLHELCSAFLSRFSSPRIKDLNRYRMRLRCILRRVDKWAPQVAKVRAIELRPAHIAQIRDHVSRRYPNGTVRNTLAGLSAVFSWARREGLLDRNPAHGVEQPSPPQRVDEWLDAEEIRRLLAEAKQRGHTCLIWRSRHVGIALGVYLGLRRGEIFGLRWRDIDLARGRVTIARSYATTPKNGKPRHLKLPSALLPILAAWRPSCPTTTEGLVVPVKGRDGIWKLSSATNSPRGLPDLLSAARCKPIVRCWHALRHSFASNFLAQGGSLLALQRILGHSEVRTTMVYAHLSNDFLDAEIERMKY